MLDADDLAAVRASCDGFVFRLLERRSGRRQWLVTRALDQLYQKNGSTKGLKKYLREEYEQAYGIPPWAIWLIIQVAIEIARMIWKRRQT